MRFVLVFVVYLVSSAAACAANFEIGGVSVPPGERRDLSIAVPAGKDDPAATIPISVLHGASPGPVLAIVAGVHGFEFSPILAADRLADVLDPEKLSGAVIIVRVANRAAFEERSPNVNPFDRKNLNRVFPGDPNGTQAERLAAALSAEVVNRADFLMDVHGGDGAEWLEAFIGVYGGPLATDFELALKVAEAFEFPNIVRYNMETQEQVDRGRSLNRQGVAAGVPTILVEIGENGSRKPAHVDAIVEGVKRSLVVLEMASGPVAPAAVKPRLFDGTVSAEARHTGLFTPVAAEGRFVDKGEIIGVIRDYEGREVETVTAPASGYALYGLAGPPVQAGDGVVYVGAPVERFE